MEVLQRLLSLINSALWNKQIDENLFAGMNESLWEDLYLFAIQQGVMAIAFDGMMRLPSDLKPSLKLRMTWGLNTERIEKKHAHISTVATELNTMLRKEKINMLIFKGLSLSSYYPLPSRREFGDIDIYLFGKQEEGERLMIEAGAKRKEAPSYKHSNVFYKGIMIENHACFLNVRESRESLNLERKLLEILKQDTCLKDTENEILYPPPLFTAIHFMAHAAKHFLVDAMPLRAYCDWAIFLQAHAKDVDTEKWKPALREAGLLRLSEAITGLTFRWLELPSLVSFPVEKHPDLEECIIQEMFELLTPSSQKLTAWQTFLFKCKRFSRRYRRYAIFYDGNSLMYYVSCFFHSVLYHIRYPQTIFK